MAYAPKSLSGSGLVIRGLIDGRPRHRYRILGGPCRLNPPPTADQGQPFLRMAWLRS